jgi:uncharacterized membrane protein YagU involved in acid resistance
MDLVWFARSKRGGDDRGFVEWEFSTKPDWNEVSAPGQVGKRVVEGFLQRVMHWGYGVLWGVQYGIVAGSLSRRRVAPAMLLGPVVWASSYAVLPLAKLYKPIWQYDAETLAKDLSAHMAYGLATAITFRILTAK